MQYNPYIKLWLYLPDHSLGFEIQWRTQCTTCVKKVDQPEPDEARTASYVMYISEMWPDVYCGSAP